MKMNGQNIRDTERDAARKRKTVLCFDTAVTGCAICVADGREVWTEHMDTERGQAEFLVPMINDCLRKSGYTYNDIDRIAVTIGPGSFTGVRVGLSTAKALGLSLNKPVFGFETLSVIAQGASLIQNTLIVIDTKRGDFYGQVFDASGQPLTEPDIWSSEKVASSSYPVLRDRVPDIEILAKLALEIETDETGYRLDYAPSPLYLRGAEVSQSKRVAPKIVKSI